jgi:hypothetical protein
MRLPSGFARTCRAAELAATTTQRIHVNAPERINLPDIQSRLDQREIGIDAVGVSDVGYPAGAFLDELQRLSIANPRFRLVATMTRVASAARQWNGETRPIGEEPMASLVGGLVASVCDAAGPPGMVSAARQALNRAGIDDDDIRSEDFHGY